MRGKTLFVGIVILLVILRVEPSRAQETTDTACWNRITTCLQTASHFTGCCTTFEEEIKNERECFCLMKEQVLTDPSIAAGMSRILAFCGFSESFLTICPGTGSNSSSPSMPSTPNFEDPPSAPTPTPPKISSISPAPADFEDPPSDPTPTPPKISSISPPPAVKPSPTQENGTSNCFTRLTSCLNKATNYMDCCSTLVQVVDYEKDCLCSQKHTLLKDPKAASAIATFLSTCNVPDSLETICSDTPTGSSSSSPPPIVPFTLPPPASPDTSINSTSSNNGTASASTSGSTNKIAHSAGLIPTLLLIIWATLLI